MKMVGGYKKIFFGLFLIAFLPFFSLYDAAFADEGTHFSVDVADTILELTVPNLATINLTPTASGAAFGNTSINLHVATNNLNGYTLSMSVPTTDLIYDGTLQNAPVIPTLATAAPEATFSVNSWGYKVSGENYLPVEIDNSPAAWESSSPTNGTDHNLTLAAKVDGTQISGSYTNTLTFNLVATPNAIKNTISFNGNGSDSGDMNVQQVYQGEPTSLYQNKFSKAGYVFNGWNTKADGLGIAYRDRDMYTAPITGSTSTLTLYAQWLDESSPSAGYAGKTLADAFEQAYVQNPGQFPKDEGGYKHGLYVPHKTNGIYDGTYFEATSQNDYEGIPANDLRFAIQDIDLPISVNGNNISICDYTTAIGSELYVLDLRDFKSYWITKMKDGTCWMTQNLDLDLSSSASLDSTTSDLNMSGSGVYSSGYSVDANNVISWRPERSTSQDKSTFSCSSYTGYYHPYSIDFGNIYEKYNTKARCDFSSRSCANYLSVPDSINKEHGHIGNHYNHNSVIATNDSSSIASNRVMENSICPKGWRLPIRNYSGSSSADDFVSLANAYNFYGSASTNSALIEPMYFVHGDTLNWSTLTYNGSSGYASGDYWTASLYSGYSQGIFSVIDGSYLHPNGNASWRSEGRSVRCIAR